MEDYKRVANLASALHTARDSVIHTGGSTPELDTPRWVPVCKTVFGFRAPQSTNPKVLEQGPVSHPDGVPSHAMVRETCYSCGKRIPIEHGRLYPDRRSRAGCLCRSLRCARNTNRQMTPLVEVPLFAVPPPMPSHRPAPKEDLSVDGDVELNPGPPMERTVSISETENMFAALADDDFEDSVEQNLNRSTGSEQSIGAETKPHSRNGSGGKANHVKCKKCGEVVPKTLIGRHHYEKHVPESDKKKPKEGRDRTQKKDFKPGKIVKDATTEALRDAVDRAEANKDANLEVLQAMADSLEDQTKRVVELESGKAPSALEQLAVVREINNRKAEYDHTGALIAEPILPAPMPSGDLKVAVLDAASFAGDFWRTQWNSFTQAVAVETTKTFSRVHEIGEIISVVATNVLLDVVRIASPESEDFISHPEVKRELDGVIQDENQCIDMLTAGWTRYGERVSMIASKAHEDEVYMADRDDRECSDWNEMGIAWRRFSELTLDILDSTWDSAKYLAICRVMRVVATIEVTTPVLTSRLFTLGVVMCQLAEELMMYPVTILKVWWNFYGLSTLISGTAKCHSVVQGFLMFHENANWVDAVDQRSIADRQYAKFAFSQMARGYYYIDWRFEYGPFTAWLLGKKEDQMCAFSTSIPFPRQYKNAKGEFVFFDINKSIIQQANQYSVSTSQKTGKDFLNVLVSTCRGEIRYDAGLFNELDPKFQGNPVAATFDLLNYRRGLFSTSRLVDVEGSSAGHLN